MRVLAVDTTTPNGSAAVVSDEGVLAEARVRTGSGHSRWLLPAVQALLGGLGVEPRAVELFAVTTGPGSFTGLRVGISSVQGLALASARPCVGLSTLDVLALAAAGQHGSLVALMDAFRGEVYAGFYDGEGRPTGEARVGPLDEVIAAAPAGTAFVGDAAVSMRPRIEEIVRGARFPELELYLAAPLGRAALVRAAEGRTIAASDLRPVYLRGAGIRVPRP